MPSVPSWPGLYLLFWTCPRLLRHGNGGMLPDNRSGDAKCKSGPGDVHGLTKFDDPNPPGTHMTGQTPSR